MLPAKTKTMGVLNNAFPPAAFYNRLPFIHTMENIAERHADDLSDLRSLLDKHEMPATVCIKLIHIHFHLNEGEILTVREIDAGHYGKIPFLEPKTAKNAGKVYGCNYVVDSFGSLRAFEYTESQDAESSDLAMYPAFVADFCAAVEERGLQDKFGIAINSGVSQLGSWMELDYPEKRATFLLPSTISLPRNDRVVLRMTVTKFPGFRGSKHGPKKAATHIHVEHTWGTTDQLEPDQEEALDGLTAMGGLKLTGIVLHPGTAFYNVASIISSAA